MEETPSESDLWQRRSSLRPPNSENQLCEACPSDPKNHLTYCGRRSSGAPAQLEEVEAAIARYETGTMEVASGGTRSHAPGSNFLCEGDERIDAAEGAPNQRASGEVGTDGRLPAASRGNDNGAGTNEDKNGDMSTSEQSFHTLQNGLGAELATTTAISSDTDALLPEGNVAIPLQENIMTQPVGVHMAAASLPYSDANLNHASDLDVNDPSLQAPMLPETIAGHLVTATTALDPFQAAPTLPVHPQEIMISDAMYADIASSMPDSELAPFPDIKAFAKLQFDDGAFYMNTYAVEIGRDMRAAKRAFYREMEQKELREQRIKESSSIREGSQTPNEYHIEDNARMCHSLVSNSGGIMGEDDYETQPMRRKTRSRKSKSTTSSSRHLSRMNSMVLPNGDRDYQALAMRSLRDANDVAQLDITALRPSPHECPLIPIHPPTMPAEFGSKHNSISRTHIRIAYNFDKNHFEMTVLGRNGAFHNGNHYAPGQVEPLHNGSEIQIGGVFIRFLLPDGQADDAAAECDEASQSKMSFEFENGRGDRITMADSSEQELDEQADVESSEESEEDAEARLNDEGTLSAAENPEEVDEEHNDGGRLKDDENEVGVHAAEEEAEGEAEEEEEEEEEEQSLSALEDKSPPKKVSKSKSQKSKSKFGRRKGRKPVGRKSAPPKTNPEKRLKPEPKAMQTKAKIGIEKQDSKESKDKNIDIKETTEQTATPIKPEDLPPTIVIPPRRKGPGRPPKNGFMSKREQTLINKHQKEVEKRVALGLSPPPELDLNQGKVTKSRKTSGDVGEGGDGKETPVRQKTAESKESSKQPPLDAEAAAQQPSPPVEKPVKPVRQPRSPSPPMQESDFTEEQLVKPPQNYVYLIFEAITNSKTGSLSLPQIYSAIEHAHPFFRFRAGTQGWQSSVRHNLGQNPAFQKVSKEGKGYTWGIVPGAVVEKEKRKRVSPPPQPQPCHPPVPHQGPYLHGYSPQVSGAYPATGYPAYAGPYSQYAPVPQLPRPNQGLPAPQPVGTAASTYSSPYGPLRQQPLQRPPQGPPPGQPFNGPNGHSSQPYQNPHPQAPPIAQYAPTQNRRSPSALGPGYVSQLASAPAPQSTPVHPTLAQTTLTSAAIAEEISRFKQIFIDNAKGTSKNNNEAWISRTFDNALLRLSKPEMFSKPPETTEKNIMKAIEELLRHKTKPQGDGQPTSVPYGQPLPPHALGGFTNGMSEVGQEEEGRNSLTPGPYHNMNGTSPTGHQQDSRSSSTPVPNDAMNVIPPVERGLSGQTWPMQQPQSLQPAQPHPRGHELPFNGQQTEGSYLQYSTPLLPGPQTQQEVPASHGTVNQLPSATAPRTTSSRTPSNASTPGIAQGPPRYQSPSVHTPPVHAVTATQHPALQVMQANNVHRNTPPHLSLNASATESPAINSPTRPVFEALTPPPVPPVPPAADGPAAKGAQEGMSSPKRKRMDGEVDESVGDPKRRLVKGMGMGEV